MIKDKSILIKNIYYMLSYAFQTLNKSEYEDVAVEEFKDMHNLFATILAKGIGFQLKQGLYREYINRQENLSVMRGKINMPGTIRNRMARKQILTCEFDELSEDNLLNQVLKATVMLLLRHGSVKPEYKDDLKKKMLFFSNVDTVEPTSIRWSSIRFQRNNQNYRMLLSICQLIIEGMLLTTDKGDYRLATFLDEQRMCRLYEKFILEYYTKHYPTLSVRASQIPWSLDDGIGTMLPVMQSDITLQLGSTVLIIDAKYYSHTMQQQYDKHTLHSNNLYQIFTYVKNRDYDFGENEHKVSGMLLYAKTDEEIQPNNVYQMHGNQITVRTLDLNLPFAEIARQLDEIVETHFDLQVSTRMNKQEKRRLLQSLLDERRANSFYEALENMGDLKTNYSDYMNTGPISCAEELKRVADADYELCTALLTMLLREDHFSNGSFERRVRAGEVKPLLERMIDLLAV